MKRHEKRQSQREKLKKLEPVMKMLDKASNGITVQEPRNWMFDRMARVEEIYNGILPLTDAAIELAWLMGGCQKLVRSRPQSKALEEGLSGVAPQIAKWEDRLTKAAAKYPGSFGSLKGPLSLCYRWRLAIYHFVETGDRGPLELLAFDGQDWRDTWREVGIKVGGRPSKMSKWRADYAFRAWTFTEQNPIISPYNLYNKIIDSYEDDSNRLEKGQELSILGSISKRQLEKTTGEPIKIDTYLKIVQKAYKRMDDWPEHKWPEYLQDAMNKYSEEQKLIPVKPVLAVE